MQAYLKKAVYFAVLLGTLALVLGSTGCTSDGQLRRPGWIVANR